MKLLSVLLGVALTARTVQANVEKVIFLGPKAVNIPSQHPTISDLHLDVLEPGNSSKSKSWSIRTNITVEISRPHSAIPEAGDGEQTWLLLDNLVEGQRYEVRICWAATQPTAFDLRVHELPKVFANSVLISDLSKYAYGRLAQADGTQTSPKQAVTTERTASVLFLQIFAVADYFTTDKELMAHPQPVLVDIILDPFILNVLPRSLVPTVCYIIVIAIISWFVARRVADWLQDIATTPDEPAARGETKKKQ